MKKAGKDKELNIRERRFVAAKAKGMTHVQAMKEAGYSVSNPRSSQVKASEKLRKPHIQQAIEDALQMHGASPEFAVLQLKKVAEQDSELGAKRLASKDILELHGWSKTERPSMHIEFSGNFFNSARNNEARSERQDVIEGEEA